jgi:hypothetical protein
MSAMASERVAALKAAMDGLVGEAEAEAADLDEEWSDDERVIYEEAIANFRGRGPDLLDEATPHLWAYYDSVASAFTEEQRREYEIPELDRAIDIWQEVTIELPPALTIGRPPHTPDPSYLSFEGNVSWEPEHGLQLVFAHGSSVCKVGPYDGHETNANAYDDLELLGVVYC